MHTLRVRPFMYFAMGIAVTAVAVWSLSAWRASAAVSADESTFVNVSPTRILDTRSELGLAGPFRSLEPLDLGVTGSVPIAPAGNAVVVPDGATGVILNVTVVSPTADGFVSVRPADAAGAPNTSSLNFNAGDVIPNSVTVQLPTAGADAGKIEITYNASEQAGPTTDILVDVVGYTKNSGLASLQAQVDQLQAQLAAAAAQGVFDGDPAGGDLTGSYPSPGLGTNSVGTNEIINGTVGLAEMNAASVTATVNAGALLAGECSPDVNVTAPGASSGSIILILRTNLAAPGTNPGWRAQSGATAGAGQANIQICNATGAPLDPPELDVTFIALGP